MNATAIINIAKAELAIDDDDYRDLLERVTGQRSLRAMSERQKRDVLDELKRLGFRVKTSRPARTASKPYIRLIHALWKNCQRLGVIDNGSREALRAFCARFVDQGSGNVAVDPDLLSYDQASPVIEALKKMEARGLAAERKRGRHG
ncbi:regulatory protein GemA [Acidimangrovimonas sediminis]|uniref:regulatory protein GemA n=1 Tax=Acidimangrovimonas sediminis TaxID=2056283 RepID=UPI000C7FD805|nr:regulatory protein GemA [Acidimangrovimonas sediminis]